MNYRAVISSLEILNNTVMNSRRIYERYASNGADIHQFINLLQTVQSSIQLVKSKIDSNCSKECIESTFNQTKTLVYEFVKFVGNRVDG